LEQAAAEARESSGVQKALDQFAEPVQISKSMNAKAKGEPAMVVSQVQFLFFV
jgi:hypothetical protein